MPRKTKYNWPEIFSHYEQSGLSQVEYCKLHNLNAKYFSLKLSKNTQNNDSAFIQALPNKTDPQSNGLILEVGNCKIHCPESMPLPSFITLVQSLA